MSVTSVFRPSDIPTGLQGYWKLDEASGVRADSSGNGNTLTDNKTVGGDAFNYWDSENSADFIRANSESLSITDAAQVGLNPNGAGAGSVFSCAFWFRHDNIANSNVFIRKNAASPNGFEIDFGSPSGGNFRIYFNNAGGYFSSTVIPTGKWTHVAIVYDRTNNKLNFYIDGNLDFSQTVNVDITDNAIDFQVGGSAGASFGYFGGNMKDLAWWNTVLTPIEVKSLAFGIDRSADTYRPDSVSTAPDAFWKLNEVSAGTGAVQRDDSSGNAHHLTDSNTTPSGAGYIEGAGANFQTANSEYLIAADSADWDFGTGDFSFCTWFQKKSNVWNALIAPTGTNVGSSAWFMVAIDDNGTGVLTVYTESTIHTIPSTTTNFALDTWYHVAVVRRSGVLYIYVDGELLSTTANTIDIQSPDAIDLGHWWSGGTHYYANTRQCDTAIWKGYALTEAEITSLATGLPIQQTGIVSYWALDEAQLDKQVQAIGNAQIDTAQSKFGGASLLLDGTGDYLLTPDSEDWNIGTGNYTVDFWIRYTSITDTWFFSWGAGPNLGLRLNGGSMSPYQAGVTNGIGIAFAPTLGQWYHIAQVRNGTTLTVYIDGVASGSSATASQSITGGATAFSVGAFNAGTSSMNGHIDEFRVSRNARWTSNFTPEVAEYTTDEFTALLLHMDGNDGVQYFKDSSAPLAENVMSANGNTQVDTAQSVFGGASALFDGVGDSLSTTLKQGHVFALAPFTVDFRVRFNTITTRHGFITAHQDGSNHWMIGWEANLLRFRTKIAASLTIDFSFAWVPVINTWYHVAVTRDGNNFRAFVDGVQIGITQVDTDTVSPLLGGSILIGGTFFESAGGFDFHDGWIDEIRISNGIARFTAGFTPAVAEYTADSFDTLLLHCNGTDASIVFPEETGGTGVFPFVREDSIGSNDLTDNNTVNAVLGKVGNAGQFVAANSEYLSITDAAQAGLDLLREFTILVWFKPTTLGVTHALVDKDGLVGLGYAITVATLNKFEYYLRGAGTQSLTSVVAGVFSHAVMVFDGATKRGFFNGSQEVSAVATVAPSDNAVDFRLGARNVLTNFANGVIDEPIVATRWFRNEEIKAVYVLGNTNQAATAAPVPPPPPTLIQNSGLFLAFPM